MKNKKWIELTSEVVLETPFFKLFKKDFRKPDGVTVKDYYKKGEIKDLPTMAGILLSQLFIIVVIVSI